MTAQPAPEAPRPRPSAIAAAARLAPMTAETAARIAAILSLAQPDQQDSGGKDAA